VVPGAIARFVTFPDGLAQGASATSPVPAHRAAVNESYSQASGRAGVDYLDSRRALMFGDDAPASVAASAAVGSPVAVVAAAAAGGNDAPTCFHEDRLGDREQLEYGRAYAPDLPAYTKPPHVRVLGDSNVRTSRGAGQGLHEAPDRYYEVATAPLLQPHDERELAEFAAKRAAYRGREALHRTGLALRDPGAQRPDSSSPPETQRSSHPASSFGRLAAVLAQGYARQGLAVKVGLGVAGEADVQDTEGFSDEQGQAGAARRAPPVPQFLPLQLQGVAAVPASADASPIGGLGMPPLKRALNKRVAEHPDDAAAWRALLRHVADEAAGKIPAGLPGSGVRKAARAKQEAVLAVYDRALEHLAAAVGAAPEVGLRAPAPIDLVLGRMAVLAQLHDHPSARVQLDREWAATLAGFYGTESRANSGVAAGARPALHPGVYHPGVWLAYLHHVRASYGTFTMPRFRAAARCAMRSLLAWRPGQGAPSMPACRGTGAGSAGAQLCVCVACISTRRRESAALTVFAAAAQAERAAGRDERCIAMWQALFEVNIGCPPSLRAAPWGVRLRWFRAFWASGHARVGDSVRQPSHTVHPGSAEGPVPSDGDFDAAITVGGFAAWFKQQQQAGTQQGPRRAASRWSSAGAPSAGPVASESSGVQALRAAFNAAEAAEKTLPAPASTQQVAAPTPREGGAAAARADPAPPPIPAPPPVPALPAAAAVQVRDRAQESAPDDACGHELVYSTMHGYRIPVPRAAMHRLRSAAQDGGTGSSSGMGLASHLVTDVGEQAAVYADVLRDLQAHHERIRGAGPEAAAGGGGGIRGGGIVHNFPPMRPEALGRDNPWSLALAAHDNATAGVRPPLHHTPEEATHAAACPWRVVSFEEVAPMLFPLSHCCDADGESALELVAQFLSAVGLEPQWKLSDVTVQSKGPAEFAEAAPEVTAASAARVPGVVAVALRAMATPAARTFVRHLLFRLAQQLPTLPDLRAAIITYHHAVGRWAGALADPAHMKLLRQLAKALLSLDEQPGFAKSAAPWLAYAFLAAESGAAATGISAAELTLAAACDPSTSGYAVDEAPGVAATVAMLLLPNAARGDASSIDRAMRALGSCVGLSSPVPVHQVQAALSSALSAQFMAFLQDKRTSPAVSEGYTSRSLSRVMCVAFMAVNLALCELFGHGSLRWRAAHDVVKKAAAALLAAIGQRLRAELTPGVSDSVAATMWAQAADVEGSRCGRFSLQPHELCGVDAVVPDWRTGDLDGSSPAMLEAAPLIASLQWLLHQHVAIGQQLVVLVPGTTFDAVWAPLELALRIFPTSASFGDMATNVLETAAGYRLRCAVLLSAFAPGPRAAFLADRDLCRLRRRFAHTEHNRANDASKVSDTAVVEVPLTPHAVERCYKARIAGVTHAPWSANSWIAWARYMRHVLAPGELNQWIMRASCAFGVVPCTPCYNPFGAP
jgi:hypothetical protein